MEAQSGYDSLPEFTAFLAEARAGSKRAKEKLLIPYREVFRRWAGQDGGDAMSEMDNSDLSQEIFLVAWEKFGQFQGNTPGQMHAWMKKLFANEWNRIWRFWHRSKRDVDREISWEMVHHQPSLADNDINPLMQLVHKEEGAILREALASLSYEELNALVWRYYYQECYLEIGKRTNRSPEAARLLCHRAKKKLQEYIVLAFGGGWINKVDIKGWRQTSYRMVGGGLIGSQPMDFPGLCTSTA